MHYGDAPRGGAGENRRAGDRVPRFACLACLASACRTPANPRLSRALTSADRSVSRWSWYLSRLPHALSALLSRSRCLTGWAPDRRDDIESPRRAEGSITTSSSVACSAVRMCTKKTRPISDETGRAAERGSPWMSGLVDDLADEGENADGQRSDCDGDDAHLSESLNCSSDQ